MSDAVELRCENIDDCGRYFDVDPDDATGDTVRCPYCGTSTSVPDDIEAATEDGADTAGETVGTTVSAEPPVTLRITIEIESTGGGR